MKTNITVSAIITTYNREPNVLKRAIDSVLNQSYCVMELIIINDSPNYKFRTQIDDLINSYDSKLIKYVINDTNMGAGFSRNKGIEISNGEIIAFLDDDDQWLSDKLLLMVPFISEKIGLVYCDINIIEHDELHIKEIPEYHGCKILEHLLKRNYLGGFSGPILKKSIVLACGGMDELLLSSQDADLWRRMSKICDFKHVAKPLINYYVMDSSITSDPKKRLQGTIELLEKYKEDYRIYPKIKRKHVHNSIINYIDNGWNNEALIMFKREYKGIYSLFFSYVLLIGKIKKITKKLIKRVKKV